MSELGYLFSTEAILRQKVLRPVYLFFFYQQLMTLDKAL